MTRFAIPAARKTRAIATSASLACAMICGSCEAHADDSNVRSLRYDLGGDLSASIGASLVSLAIELEKDRLTAKHCHVCSRDADGRDTLNGFDAYFHRALLMPDTNVPNVASYITGFGLVPAFTFGSLAGVAAKDNAGSGTPVDFLLAYEAVAIAGVIDEIAKEIVVRERPYVHFSSDPSSTTFSSDSRLSFYSGHTTGTFALATAAGTIASMRGYSQAPLVWIAGMTMAATTGYLRIAAEHHYMTDVLVGALMGALVGFGVPYIFHRPETPSENLGNISTPLGNPGLIQLGAHF